MVFDLLPRIGLKPKDYLLKIVLPAMVTSIILTVLGVILFKGIVLYLYLLLPTIIFVSAIGYPYIVLDSQKNKINERLHIFITKFGTLSITDLNRKDLLKILSEEKEELGNLSNEAEKLYVLTDKWGRSLAEACRFLAQRTPSREFADFLDRLAYALDSGEELKEFLMKEQDIVMEDYAAFYKRMLYSLDLYKELYVSAMTSVAFFLAFSILVPFLLPYNFVFMATIALFAFFAVEILIVVVIRNRLPFDRLWHTGEKPTEIDKKLKKWAIISFLISMIILPFFLWAKYVVGLSPFSQIPYMLLIALGFTPLAIGGIIALKEEERVKRKEFVFPEFLRSLGDSVSAKGGGMVSSLEYLSNHDFGPLTSDIKRLYKRLALGIDSNKSWRFFGIESCSYLIQLFSDIFSRCIYFGGDPKTAAEIISKNFRKIVQLRKSKYQNIQQFVGVVYGLGGGLSLALFASLGVAKMINDLYSSLNIPETVIHILNIAPISNVDVVEYIIFGSLVVYAAISAVLIKIMDGGHKFVSLLHFVAILWICSIVAYITKLIVSQLLGISVPLY